MTDSAHIWRQVSELVAGAHEQVTLVAPFIKKEVLAATLAIVPGAVENITCVTRWIPEEIAAGVSDPEIIELAAEDERLHIALCPRLHAKLYLADNLCLLGSANLTGKATGLAPYSNIEILVEIPADHAEVSRALTDIQMQAIQASPHMAELARKQADLLKAEPEHSPRQEWYPVTRRPEAVYGYYCGRAQYSRSVEAAILRDLAFLGVPPGLPEPEFSAWIEARLHAIPLLKPLANGGTLTNVELQTALQQSTGMTDELARRATETIAAWLRQFGRFYTDVGTWEIRPGQELT
ncbi:phospholipase D family protein [Nocardia sp. NPDC050799]|uniref:phospholipase D family protein n=1 Tax=Nocardia sp. NPDC050799 TaxID=3154842 RepID=UPI0033E2EFCA